MRLLSIYWRPILKPGVVGHYEANIEAKSGWPLPKPSTNYPVLSTVLEGYNYIPWPPYKPPSTEQWTHCEVLISGIKSLNITFITKSI